MNPALSINLRSCGYRVYKVEIKTLNMKEGAG
jgi:hypothetical protein